MSDEPADHGNVLEQFAAMQETGEAANGWVKVQVDGTGDMTGLVIEPRAMRLSSHELAEAVREAFGQARAAVNQRVEEAMPEVMRQSAPELQVTLKEVEASAQRGLNEMLTLAGELSGKLDRLMRQNP
ncbi:hypothetical protein Misp01_26940 [Microtetraspora sp. NBRC 13810]|uniref:YbaB/EbfC family nucleoid-associated protein n=1 Tax=Microtetraspora sp. NBRC 13810 TaxID=3030990 RepID=UPI0024A5C0F0|nr:YbaB/EbfC family nucleoid-associated protein [Microtetraspora sp. NBRC 13810]GLW07564.1 hypothetical protein Misp01_26940 [Microtetraspora sp. NBRC 13810]